VIGHPVGHVQIEEGCIACKLCQDMVPEVFQVLDDGTCIVKPDAPAWFARRAEDIRDAARDCPVEVIKVDGA
jgi:ferredoxin